MSAIDPVALSQSLIRCPSVTPADAGALDILERALSALGFTCHRLKFEEVDNLYARIGNGAPNFCYAGHTDVVPPGDVSLWRYGPFEAEIRGDTLFGRGAADMKSSIAAFVNAVSRYLPGRMLNGSISLLITGDEEGPSINGTAKVLEWMKAQGETI
ncbi:MAG TPA: M20/M25/M40 family metallo-hydrolase, partial [Rhizomicrobium sp.]|nr:M20/M25/M40 family metallo-hydrolase [Rhizomicrobium sp.]